MEQSKATIALYPRFFPGGKERPGRDADPTPLLSAVDHERVELYLYSRYGPTACTEPQCLYKRCTLALHEDKCTFLVISRSVLNRMRKYRSKIVEKIKTHILYSVTFFISLTFCEIMWENIVEKCRQRMTLWRMRIAC
jgi:hypothetical protein